MKNQAYRMTMLFDFYGEILTERQREFYDLYYNDDLSLSEIAQNSGITRQGVRDVIVRAENILVDLEEKTGIIARFHQNREQLNKLEKSVQMLKDLASYNDDHTLKQLAEEISATVAELQKE